MTLPPAILLDDNCILNLNSIEEMFYVEDEGVKLITIRTANSRHHSFLAEGAIMELWNEWKKQAVRVTYPPESMP